MIYKKPDDMKYTDMCIWVDNLVERGNPSEVELDTAYKYLYHIIFMLAHKHKYFNQSHYYEEFAIYLAAEVLNRLFLNPKLKGDEDNPPAMNTIKSCLNYIKAIIYGRKVLFEQQNYSQKFSNETSLTSEYNFNTKIRESLTFHLESDINLYLNTISRVVRHFVYKNSPYVNDPIMMKNIYISTLLSLLNGITLTQADIDSIRQTYSTPEAKYRYVIKVYNVNKQHSTVLYHLPKSMYNYITVLVRQILKIISEDIKELSALNLAIPDAVLSDIVYTELDGRDVDE